MPLTDSPEMEALLEQGVQALGQGHIGEAGRAFQQVLQLDPGHVGARNNLANCLQATGHIREAAQQYRQLLSQTQPPLAWRVASNYLIALQYLPGLTPMQLKAAAGEIGSQLGQAQVVLPAQPGKICLRLGFLGADLCDHPVGLLLRPLLRALDRRRFEPLLMSTGGRDDATRHTLKSLAPWQDVGALDCEALVQHVRQQSIDILVDLSGHTAGNRLPAFACRMAPLQISWLGYFATTGVPAMDAVLLDPWQAPPGTEAHFTERLVCLPDTRWCYEPVEFAPTPAAAPCLRKGYTTFGCFNNTSKLNAEVFATWAQILHAVPHSRLVLKWSTFADPEYSEKVSKHFLGLGIEPDRLELRGRSYHADLLREYADIDIALDPFPFTGGHTSCEALWMGVPVITLVGETPVARQTWSMLNNIGLPELAAADRPAYVERAVSLAKDPKRLAALRGGLRGRMAASPLMDARAFARHFEAALQQLWQTGPGKADQASKHTGPPSSHPSLESAQLQRGLHV